MSHATIESSKTELLARIQELEAQLESQETLHDLIQSLHTHQEELRSQQDALVHSQRELEASRDRYAELYDFAPVPILTLGPNGVIEALNLAAARLIGVDRAIAIGMPLIAYLHADSRRPFLDHLMHARRGSKVVRTEIRLSPRNRKEVPVEIQSKAFQPDDDRKATCQCVLIDLSDQRRHEEERRRATDERERIRREEAAARAASDAKDRFLAVLSHELRTPLTPILLTLETLGDAESSPAQRRSMATIRRNTEVMARLIDDLLDVTRIAHDKLHLSLAPVPMNTLLRSVVEMCESELEQRRIALDLRLESEEAYVLGDPLRLRQTFWNLLRNAVQHSANGGRVRIHCQRRGDRSLLVEVSDDGSGIEPEELERLFEPFQQAATSKPGSGLGLGLAICRGLVEAHGGTIHASSEGAGRGARFAVLIPTCPAPKSLPRGALARPPKYEPLRILVVEDHVDTAEAMQVALMRLGYKVRLAHSLEEGRTRALEPFDVLISDVQLPDGSGLDLMRELSAAHPVKGIAMSGFGTEKDVQRSREAGFQTHLVKPVDVHRVAEAIDALSHA